MKNHCSLEVSMDLFEAGIEIETDTKWVYDSFQMRWFLSYKNTVVDNNHIPAPTFTEILEKLPYKVFFPLEEEVGFLTIQKYDDDIKMFYIIYGHKRYGDKNSIDDNPANVAAGLLIWLKEYKNKGYAK